MWGLAEAWLRFLLILLVASKAKNAAVAASVRHREKMARREPETVIAFAEPVTRVS